MSEKQSIKLDCIQEDIKSILIKIDDISNKNIISECTDNINEITNNEVNLDQEKGNKIAEGLKDFFVD